MSDFWFKSVLKFLMLPPGPLLLISFLGLVLIARSAIGKQQRSFKLGFWFLAFSTLLFYLASTGHVASALAQLIENKTKPLGNLEARQNAYTKAQAIVILAGGDRNNAIENESGLAPNAKSLERLQYGARLARESKLPILITGGVALGSTVSEAASMVNVLRSDFGLEPKWIEQASLDTRDNAVLSAKLLAQEKITTVLLVTHANHMTRSVQSFQGQGLSVIAAPMGFSPLVENVYKGWLPSARAFLNTVDALHEIVGTWWYAFRSGNA
jgi:uncharacterized SAM-binding protein YcdF (DUF218 family)